MAPTIRENQSASFGIGSHMPKFRLKSVDESWIDETYFAASKCSLIVFSCNHCPYVKGSEEMLISTIKKFSREDLKCVSISANDPIQYPEDSFENMKRKAEAMKLPYPYLFDEDQSVAPLFDAECTPECYLFDGNYKLVYQGAINDSPRDASKVTKNYLETAITQVLEGQTPHPSFVHSIGCSIKWKQ